MLTSIFKLAMTKLKIRSHKYNKQNNNSYKTIEMDKLHKHLDQEYLEYIEAHQNKDHLETVRELIDLIVMASLIIKRMIRDKKVKYKDIF